MEYRGFEIFKDGARYYIVYLDTKVWFKTSKDAKLFIDSVKTGGIYGS